MYVTATTISYILEIGPCEILNSKGKKTRKMFFDSLRAVTSENSLSRLPLEAHSIFLINIDRGNFSACFAEKVKVPTHAG